MARLCSTVKGEVTLFVDKIRGGSAGINGVSFRDGDGASINLSGDVLAHIISLTFHELKTDKLSEILRLLCTCK
jgi:hypothetical protein